MKRIVRVLTGGVGWVLVSALGCGCASEVGEEDTAAAEQPIMTANQMTANQLTLNSLAANGAANQLLPKVALTTATFAIGGPQPLLAEKLRWDPDAREFFHYLVECALPAGQTVTFSAGASDYASFPKLGLPPPPYQEIFTGQLGYCPAWQSGAVATDCQELVSACLLARNNAQGIPVPTSQLGTSLLGQPLPRAAQVTTYVKAAVAASYPAPALASFAACPPGSSGNADCGWRVPVTDDVGMCTPGQTYAVAAGGHAPGTSTNYGTSLTTDTVLRVCPGIRGCDSSTAIGYDDDSSSPPSLYPYATFVCPSAAPNKGTFSVMLAAWDRAVVVPAGAKVAADTSMAGVVYPSTEASTFAWREGHFYGNVFTPNKLAVNVYLDPVTHQAWTQQGVAAPILRAQNPVVPGSVFGDMWACYSSRWTNGEATALHRFCAHPAASGNAPVGGCAATSLGACGAQTPVSNGLSYNWCEQDGTASGYPAYNACVDGNWGVRMHGLTVMLNDQCDTTGPGPYCGGQ